MRERGMLYMGGFASPQDRATPRIIERNELKVGFLAYTITRRTDGSLSLDRIRFMPTYTVGMPQTPEYKVIPLADAGSLGWVDVNKSRADITAHMNTYTPVEVVDYLD